MSSKKQELMELDDERLQIEKDTLGAVTASEKLPSAEEAVEALKKDLSGYDEDFSYRNSCSTWSVIAHQRSPWIRGFFRAFSFERSSPRRPNGNVAGRSNVGCA